MSDRTSFTRAYAERSGLDAPEATLGLLGLGGGKRIAMPCGCGETDCQGWAMVGIDGLDHHLRFSAPKELRSAYCDAIEGGQQGEPSDECL